MNRFSAILGSATFVLVANAPLGAQSITPEPSGAGSTLEMSPLVPSINAGDDAILVEVPTDPKTVDPTPVLVRPAKVIEEETDDGADEEDPDSEIALDAAPPEETERGLVVRVEQVSSTGNAVDAKDVKLFAPFSPKPLAPIPEGWQLRRPGDAKPFSREVDLGGGNKVTLSILPFVLAPNDESENVFSIREPGYRPALQYRQLDTVGALLTEYTEQLEQSDARMTEAINRLNQLLLSFPQDLE